MIVKFLRQVLYFEECLFRLAELQPKLGALDPQCVLQWHWTSGNGDCAGTTGRFEPGFAWPWRANHPLYRHYEIQGDELLLSGKWDYQGEQLTFTVHWRRVKAK